MNKIPSGGTVYIETNSNNHVNQALAKLKKMDTVFYEGITIDGKSVRVGVKNNAISSVCEIKYNEDLPDLLPVLVDAQHNGSLGISFNSLDENNAPGDLQKIAEYMLSHGTGRVLATLPTASGETLEKSASAIGKVLDNNETLNRFYAGIFHEGVFISPQKGWRGAHDPAFIRQPDYSFIARLNALSGNRIKVVNVAPEEPGGLDFIKNAVSDGIKVAIGHCAPDTDTIKAAVKAGAEIVTHFANGAAPEIHRFKNPFWGFLSEERLALGLIGDGFHLPPEVVKTAIAAKGCSKCFMVSDASAFAGCPPGEYCRNGGVSAKIEDNGFIHVIGQDILAGAYFQNDRSVEYLVNNSIVDFKTAWKMCSIIPAEICGITLPDITVGAEASFVISRFENGKLNILKTIFCGREYLPA